MMKRIVAVLCACLLFSGCSGVTIKAGNRGMLPVIPRLDRPTLVEIDKSEQEAARNLPPVLLEKINENTKRIHGYAMKLEDAVRRYNAYAEQNNALVRAEMGMPAIAPEKLQGGPETPDTGKAAEGEENGGGE